MKSFLLVSLLLTASVGAMLCLLCANHSVPNFYFRASALKPYSTVKHIGVIDLRKTRWLESIDQLKSQLLARRNNTGNRTNIAFAQTG